MDDLLRFLFEEEMVTRVVKVFAIAVIIMLMQLHFNQSTEYNFFNRTHDMSYEFGEPRYHSDEFGPLRFKSSSEGGSYFWTEVEKEFYTETGGYITIRYVMFLGIYVDVTDEERNRKSANMTTLYEDEI